MNEIKIFSSSSYRYEKKFLVTQLSLHEIEFIIKNNPAIFREIFYQRQVNNIYFDSHTLVNYLDNIEGETKRKKIRIRWYGDLFGDIEKPVLEIKVKNGLLGKKLSMPIKTFSIQQDMDFTEILNLGILENNVFDYRSVVPTLLNSYSRKYFLSCDGKFRITLDTNQLFYNLYEQKKPKNRSTYHESVIVELKYSQKEDPRSNIITTRFPFRLTKSSKYVTGIQKTSKKFSL
jgi:SPX domain protein involved in polyphosphate accumulation